MTHAPLRIDIWSDIACPWCFIGKRKFEAGVELFRAEHPGADVAVEYHSYELAPDTPVDFAGTEIEFLVAHKGVPAERAQAMLDRVTDIAASVGLSYDFAALQHTNTGLAHELLHHAKRHGLQLEMKERLLRAYFIEGRHVGRVDDLVDLAEEVGLDRAATVDALTTRAHRAAVDADVQRARTLGITGVPFFVIDDAYGISGAQDPTVFADVLDQASQAREANPSA